MPYLRKENLALYYSDQGQGEAIITLHGLSESGLYWTLPGITDGLNKAGYRVVNMDMRGHGYSRVDGHDKGYKAEVMANDIDALADHLGLGKFHLLAHASGGMIAFRYAIEHSNRLLSLMATNTGSATLPTDNALELIGKGIPFCKVNFTETELGKIMIASFRNQTWENVMRRSRDVAKQHPYLNRMHKAENPEAAFAMFEACAKNSTPDLMADFIDSFYDDPDPQVAGLRRILCPVLMLGGEYDYQFLKPAELVAQEVTNCEHIVMDGLGHMLALESPARTLEVLTEFLGRLSHS